MCGAMLHIAPQDLLWSLDNLAAGAVINRVQVDDQQRADARLALQRMLALAE
jgi:quinolinate synthase